MPRSIDPLDSKELQKRITAMAVQVRDRRKTLGVSATSAAEAAGMSRVTWHRIEKGETSVTLAAWLNALAVLGLAVSVRADDIPGSDPTRTPAAIPVRIPVEQLPGLAKLAWQVRDRAELTPQEAWDIYRRNRHRLDELELSPSESELIAALEAVFGAGMQADV